MNALLYKEYRASEAWQKLRLAVIARAKGRCENCNSIFGTDVHHLTYVRVMCELLTDLQLLCIPCHRKAHPEKRKKQRPVVKTCDNIATLAQAYLTTGI